MKAYHFLREDMTGGYGNEPPWKMDYYDSIQDMRFRVDALNGFVKGYERDNSAEARQEVEALNQKMEVLARIRRELALHHYTSGHPGASQDCEMCSEMKAALAAAEEVR